MGLNDKAIELANVLKTTGEFSELRHAKSVIDRSRSLKAEMEELNRKQTALYSGKYSSFDAEAGMKELGRRYDDISRIPEIERYLKATVNFNSLMTVVFKTVNDSISDSLR